MSRATPREAHLNRTLVRLLWIAVIFLSFIGLAVRGYAIGLAVATIRPIIGSFFAAALMRGHTPDPKESFGTAFWIGFTLQTIAAEIWINYTRPHKSIELQTTTPGLS